MAFCSKIHVDQVGTTPFQSAVMAKIKKQDAGKFNPVFQILMIPGFGPLTFKALAIQTLLEGLISGLGRGLDRRRLPKGDGHAKCWQNHPQSNHHHTLSEKNYPYHKKIRFADQFNGMLNKVSDAFKLYEESKEYFYKTLKEEVRECTRDYYRLIAKEALRNAWVELHHNQREEKALSIVDEYFREIKGQKNVDIARELQIIHALILAKMGQKKLAFSALAHLSHSHACQPLSQLEQTWATKTILGLGFEMHPPDAKMPLAFRWAFLKATKLQWALAQREQESFKAIYKNLLSHPATNHLLYALKYLKDNYTLLKQNDALSSLSLYHEKDKQSADLNFFNLDLINTFYQESLGAVVQFERIDQTLQFYENNALMQAHLNAVELFLIESEIQAKIEQITFDNYLKEPLWLECHPELFHGQTVVIIDTFSPTTTSCQSYINQLSLKEKSIASFYFPMGSKSCAHSPMKYIEPAQDLKLRLLKLLSNPSLKQLKIVCHRKGEQITQNALADFKKEDLNKISINVLSPQGIKQLNDISTHYYLSSDDSLGKLAAEVFPQRLSEASVLNKKESNVKIIEDLNYNNKILNIINNN